MSGSWLRRMAALVQLPLRQPPTLGSTPCDVMHRENKWRLLRYRPAAPGRTHRRPVLWVPSLINRHTVLDLIPGRSVVQWLTEQGHDVWMIDWGTPTDEDRYLELETIAGRYVGRAIRMTARHAGTENVHLAGYCLGGTLAAMHTAAFPEHVASLTALAAPIDFHRGDAVLPTWARTASLDVRALIAAFGNAPWPLLQASFQLLRPTLPAIKARALWQRCDDARWLEGFLATEGWGADNVSFPGAAFVAWIQTMYRDNGLVRGTCALAGRPVHLSSITCPVLAVAFQDDHIVPAPSALALLDHIGSTDVKTVVLRGGHVGAVVGHHAATTLWPRLSAFWAARDRPATDASVAHRPSPALAV